MRRALALVVLFAAAACSDQSPVAPGGFSRIPCRAPAVLVAMVTGEPFAPMAMRSALMHAVDPMHTPLGASDVGALQDAIRIVVTDISASNYDGACRLLTIAHGVLAGLPDTPATLPDRDGIRLILALTAQSLDAAMPQ